METNLLERLIEAKEKLHLLKSVRCRMTHERVLIDRHSNLPVAGITPEMEFKRRDLCDAAKRSVNLACSHTMARYSISDALDVLEEFGANETRREELNYLNTTIHNLDREKSDAEIEAARIIKKLHEDGDENIKILLEEKSKISEKISEIERRHDICAEKIEKLKDEVFAALNMAIQKEKIFG